MIDDFHHAMNLMRKPGGHLLRTNGSRGPEWYIAPDGDRIDPKTTAKVREHPQVVSEEDSLGPGLSQTWRMR
jgi:hypothetical protein